MLSLVDTIRVLRFRASYGSNDGACFGTFDHTRLRPAVYVSPQQAQRKRRPDYITIVDDFGDAVLVWIAPSDSPVRLWYWYEDPATNELLCMPLAHAGNGVYPIHEDWNIS